VLMRLLFIFAGVVALSSHARAACGPDTTPTVAAAQGLTCEVFKDDFTTEGTAAIDTGNTKIPGTCSGATYPNGICHWYVNNSWANTAFTQCTGNASNLCLQNLPPTVTADYSASGSGLLLSPQILTVTGNTTNGSNQLTSISSTTSVATLGNALVTGPGVPASTAFTLSGTTATMGNNATSSNTGATYLLKNVHNGWMMQTCAYAASGYVGTTFTGNVYIQVDASFATSSPPNWVGVQSEAESWMWPVELFTGGVSSAILNVMEMDFFDAPGGRVIYNEALQGGQLCFIDSCSGFGGPYYSLTTTYGSTTYGSLIMAPSSNAGGAGLGLVSWDNSGTVAQTMTYGQGATPSATPPNITNPVSGAFTLLPQQHYCLMLDAAPDWPMTVRSVKVWQAPATGGGSGRRSVLR
jgi:hypothetical protein